MRLIATDLDGTIVRADGSVSPRTAAAFAAAREAGVEVLLVTGRPTRWLVGLRPALGRLGTAICSNGAVVFDDDAQRVIEATVLDVGLLVQARERVLQLAPDAVFAAETVQGLHLEPGFLPSAEHREGVPEAPFDAEALAAEGVVKLLARRTRGTCGEFDELVRPELEQLVAVTHSAPGVPMIEMAALGVDKAVTLARHAERLGINAADVVAFGDMPNDVGMLRWAGTGFAVGRDQPAVRAVADRVIGTVEEDSVALAVETLLGLETGLR
ncbi:HAD family hydrolase [Galactobacter caseinivorans]|uniref:HAD family phosphatase n=1 Tax=Galactobacter caseinivorans TaxID=2676123 RepID=A0A496PIJ4_9MICC|nr:HAD family hydrolase [Galactobacter caseinivorans]RKW70312.1 HAD family phosphatase [Galactobacter caseinivorans]